MCAQAGIATMSRGREAKHFCRGFRSNCCAEMPLTPLPEPPIRLRPSVNEYHGRAKKSVPREGSEQTSAQPCATVWLGKLDRLRAMRPHTPSVTREIVRVPLLAAGASIVAARQSGPTRPISLRVAVPALLVVVVAFARTLANHFSAFISQPLGPRRGTLRFASPEPFASRAGRVSG